MNTPAERLLALIARLPASLQDALELERLEGYNAGLEDGIIKNPGNWWIALDRRFPPLGETVLINHKEMGPLFAAMLATPQMVYFKGDNGESIAFENVTHWARLNNPIFEEPAPKPESDAAELARMRSRLSQALTLLEENGSPLTPFGEMALNLTVDLKTILDAFEALTLDAHNWRDSALTDRETLAALLTPEKLSALTIEGLLTRQRSSIDLLKQERSRYRSALELLSAGTPYGDDFEAYVANIVLTVKPGMYHSSEEA